MRRIEMATPEVATTTPAQAGASSEAGTITETWPFETPLRVSALRCILRYMLLPFVIPTLGMASGAALAIVIVLDAIAAITVFATLRHLWRIQHSRRWQYLAAAIVLWLLVGLFFLSDTEAL